MADSQIGSPNINILRTHVTGRGLTTNANLMGFIVIKIEIYILEQLKKYIGTQISLKG